MIRLAAHRAEKHFGELTLFSGVSFDVGERDRIGLVGANGCGKTTLFRLITGEMRPDAGEIVLPRETRIGYMEQHVCADSHRTLWDEVESVFAPLKEAERELEEINVLLEGPQAGDAALIERQHGLQERLTAEGGLYYRSRVRSALLGLGFDEAAFQQPVSSLSGGQRSKAAMARLLLSDNNLLLLDEPTNHLDIASVEWLEDYLRAWPGAFLVISHDRYFLDRVTNRTLELCGGRLYASNGGYTAHRAERERNREIEEKHYKTAMREIRHMEESIARFRQFNREKSIRAAESKEKALEKKKEQLVVPEAERESLHFGFTVQYESGNDVVRAEELAMGFPGRSLFEHVSFLIRRCQRVFLLGPNGCGKTTLFRLIMGQLSPIKGDLLLGPKVTVGYYDQNQSDLSLGKTVIDEIWDRYPNLTQTQIRCALAAFLFRGEEVFRPVEQLSGGERARLLLLRLMLSQDNLLLLDEPTNHLDIESREALEEALDSYDGTLFIVSHDRYFINRLADKVLVLEPSGCREYPGGYDAYLEKRQQETAGTAEIMESAPAAPARGNDYQRRKEQESARRKAQTRVRRAEEAVTRVEGEIDRLKAQLADPETGVDYARLVELSAQLEQQEAELERCMEEWEAAQTDLQILLEE